MQAADRPIAFRATPTMIVGILGILLIAGLCSFPIVDGPADARVTATGALLLFGAIAWTTLIRPAMVYRTDSLLLRNVLYDVEIPWALVDDIEVRQVAVVYAGETKYLCAGLSKARRHLVRGQKEGAAQSPADQAAELGNQRAVAARRDAVGPPPAASEIERRWAWPDLTVMGLGALLFAAGLLA